MLLPLLMNSVWKDSVSNLSRIENMRQYSYDRLGQNSVSQREIQRFFNLLEFFQHLQYDETARTVNHDDDAVATQWIALSIALIYYFRLPTEADSEHRKDQSTPTREEFARKFHGIIPNFGRLIEEELEHFVNPNNFAIPQGVAINQAVCCILNNIGSTVYESRISFFVGARTYIRNYR